MTEYEFGVAIPGEVLSEDRWARTALKRLPAGLLDWSELFGRHAPVVLDLGCGNGRSTLLSALARPEMDHLGVDVLPVVIRYATRRANQRGLWNIRFAVRDAETLLEHHVAAGSVAEVHAYHPQPYHDAVRGERRLITPWFAAAVHRALVPGGLLVVQTDHPDYWSYMQRLLPLFFHLSPHPGPWPDAPEGRTRREILARRRGMPIHRAEARRRDDIDPEAAARRAQALPPPRIRGRGPWSLLDREERDHGSGE